jgi:copper chaperone CopZ
METITLNIPNISCGHCVMTVKREGSMVQGVEYVAGDVQNKTATFKVENQQALGQLKTALAEAGYPPAD